MINLEIMSGERWTDAETEYLKEHWGRVSRDEIANALKRNVAGVAERACKLGITNCEHSYLHMRRKARRERQARLLELYGSMTYEQMAELIGCNVRTLKNDAIDLGLFKAPHRRPEHRKQAVLAQYGKGKTASELARELGCTRDAIISTARDLGLCKPRAGA